MAEEDMPSPERLVIRKRRPTFSKEQRLGFSVFFGIGALAVILGSVYISRHLSTPFVIEYEGEPILAGADHAAAQLEELQTSDTDGDGISDYLEIYAYSTSPNLEDTDGDGYSDADEIASGNNPNCIAGQDCDSGEVEQSENELSDDFVEESFGSIGVETKDQLAGYEDAEALASQIDPVQILLENTTPDEVRTMFTDAGVDPEVFQDMSDEEVMALFILTVEELEESGELDDIVNEAVDSVQ